MDQPSLPSYNINNQRSNSTTGKSSDEEGTVVGDGDHIDFGVPPQERQKENVPPNSRARAGRHLTVQT